MNYSNAKSEFDHMGSDIAVHDHNIVRMIEEYVSAIIKDLKTNGDTTFNISQIELIKGMFVRALTKGSKARGFNLAFVYKTVFEEYTKLGRKEVDKLCPPNIYIRGYLRDEVLTFNEVKEQDDTYKDFPFTNNREFKKYLFKGIIRLSELFQFSPVYLRGIVDNPHARNPIFITVGDVLDDLGAMSRGDINIIRIAYLLVSTQNLDYLYTVDPLVERDSAFNPLSPIVNLTSLGYQNFLSFANKCIKSGIVEQLREPMYIVLENLGSNSKRKIAAIYVSHLMPLLHPRETEDQARSIERIRRVLSTDCNPYLFSDKTSCVRYNGFSSSGDDYQPTITPSKLIELIEVEVDDVNVIAATIISRLING